jgi:hypothetical protein
MVEIRRYADATDRSLVIAPWRDVFGYETAQDEPNVAIEKKPGEVLHENVPTRREV